MGEKCLLFEAASRQCMDAEYTRAIRLTKSAAKAEELVQMTFLKAFHAFDESCQTSEFKRRLLLLLNELYKEHFAEVKMHLPHQRYAAVG